jgi:DNA-directed RNA polymerase subunit RPC12/RpoP
MKTKDAVIECPACGSKNVEQEKKETTVCVPYGTEKKLSETSFKCLECKTTFEDDISLDEAIKTVLELSKKESVKNILNYFSENRMNFAGMERALELPQRTISRWKTEGAVDASALALLRMIRTFPWLIEVADSKYDRNISDTICFKYIADIFLQLRDREVSHSGVGIHSDGRNTLVLRYAVFSGNKDNIYNTKEMQSSETVETRITLQ